MGASARVRGRTRFDEPAAVGHAVDDQEVTPRTSRPMPEHSGTSGIDLSTRPRTLALAAGEKVRSTIPTMHAGTMLEISDEF
jgi:hypothetical protein